MMQFPRNGGGGGPLSCSEPSGFWGNPGSLPWPLQRPKSSPVMALTPAQLLLQPKTKKGDGRLELPVVQEGPGWRVPMSLKPLSV